MEKQKEAIEIDRHELLKISEISLWLDTYDDIFSDFDPRPYHQRALSDDFLLEAKKASMDKNQGIELKFLIPKNKRNLTHEALIKKRLREHFKKHLLSFKDELKKMLRQGLYFVISGIIIMFFASLILFKADDSLLFDFLVVFLEPAGWFLFWEGLGILVFEIKKKKPDLDFYDKMSKCDIVFIEY
jgi:hypothetical protein